MARKLLPKIEQNSIRFLALFLLGVLIFMPACGNNPASPNQSKPRVLTVMAASSLTEVFTDLAGSYELLHANVKVEFNFAGSQQLAQQLANGARADVFASANRKQMDVVVENGRITKDTVVNFAVNKLILIFPIANPAKITSLADLASPGVKLLLASSEVPVGQYTLELLDKATQSSAFEAGFKQQVLSNVVSYETTVKAVVVKVGLGEADAGIVYSTDINEATLENLGSIEIPDELNVVAEYSIAPIKDGNTDLAIQWIEFLQSKSGAAILQKFGFQPPR